MFTGFTPFPPRTHNQRYMKILMNYRLILRYSLIAGAVYFFCISMVHFFGIKVPGLFIYYDIPSYGYQDRIVSLLAFGWFLFFMLGSILVKKGEVKYAGVNVMAGVFALVTLIVINSSPGLKLLATMESIRNYWIEVTILAVYLSWLLVFYLLALINEDS